MRKFKSLRIARAKGRCSRLCQKIMLSFLKSALMPVKNPKCATQSNHLYNFMLHPNGRAAVFTLQRGRSRRTFVTKPFLNHRLHGSAALL